MCQRDWCFGSLTGYCGRAHRAGETCPRDSLADIGYGKCMSMMQQGLISLASLEVMILSAQEGNDGQVE